MLSKQKVVWIFTGNWFRLMFFVGRFFITQSRSKRKTFKCLSFHYKIINTKVLFLCPCLYLSFRNLIINDNEVDNVQKMKKDK